MNAACGYGLLDAGYWMLYEERYLLFLKPAANYPASSIHLKPIPPGGQTLSSQTDKTSVRLSEFVDIRTPWSSLLTP